MLTNNKEISSVEYWNKFYSGNNNNAKVDASNTKRTSTFDRFNIVVDKITADEKRVLGVASGHAHIEKRIKAKYPESTVIATDQSVKAKDVANFFPYIICSAYQLPFNNKEFDVVICTQAFEYLEFPDKFLTEAKRVANKFICTVPIGEMKAWSQLRVYTEENFKAFIEQYGTIEIRDRHDSLLLCKMKFNQ